MMFWGSQTDFGFTIKKGWVIVAIGVIIGRRLSKLVALEIERTLVSFVTVGMEEYLLIRYLVGTNIMKSATSMHITKPETNKGKVFLTACSYL